MITITKYQNFDNIKYYSAFMREVEKYTRLKSSSFYKNHSFKRMNHWEDAEFRERTSNEYFRSTVRRYLEMIEDMPTSSLISKIDFNRFPMDLNSFSKIILSLGIENIDPYTIVKEMTLYNKEHFANNAIWIASLWSIAKDAGTGIPINVLSSQLSLNGDNIRFMSIDLDRLDDFDNMVMPVKINNEIEEDEFVSSDFDKLPSGIN